MSGTVAAEASTASPLGKIVDIDSLREHLQCAIELEHSTLPPYFCALYSLDPVRNGPAVEVLTSVLVEEMLHLTLAANLLNSVGGRPMLDSPEMLPGYPRGLPHGQDGLELSLLPFGADALAQFLTIEHPAEPGAPAQGDRYDTIGQFYGAVRSGLRDLCADLGEARLFSGDPARQVTNAFHYGGSGRLIAVGGLATALAALDEIVEQGEGATRGVWDGDHDMHHPDRDEVAHYFRIQELIAGRRFRRGDSPESGPSGQWIDIDESGVRPMQRNPRRQDHLPGSTIRTLQAEFDDTYCALLAMLDHAFDGSPHQLDSAVPVMYGLKEQAEALMQTPVGDTGLTAGPAFEYVPPPARRATDRASGRER